ncbi:hypothetical protein [Photobacterium leiognathi]|nr:hypothetical protein [Photobacterium leiognathi]
MKHYRRCFDKYKEQGLVILGFPCNQFGGPRAGVLEAGNSTKVV